MTIQELGSLGEALSAVAVVVSLVYLAIQLRQNTKTMRSATYQSIVAAAAACNVTLTQSKDLARILRIGSETPDALDDDERVQFTFLCAQFFDIFENLYLQYRHGVLDEDFWAPRARAYVNLFRSPGMRAHWQICKDDYCRPFAQYLDAELARGDGASRSILRREAAP